MVMTRKWQTFTPNQSAVLWLMRDNGTAIFRDGFRRMNWSRNADGSVLIDGPGLIRQALLERALIVCSGDGYVLTDAGAQAAAAILTPPAQVERAHLPLTPFWLSDAQMVAISGWFPKSHGKARLDDRQILSGIVFVFRQNLMWGQAPAEYGGELALRRRFTQWCQSGVMDNALGHLFEQDGDGQSRLVVTTAMLMRHRSGAHAIARGYLPTFTPIDEMEAA